MVCAAEGSSLSHSRSSIRLEIGCLVDTATGFLTFTANGKEMGIFYQVTIPIVLAIICPLRLAWGFQSTLPTLIMYSYHFYTYMQLNKAFSLPLEVEPGTKLFPAVFAKATSSDVFQFEFGRIKVNAVESFSLINYLDTIYIHRNTVV